MKALIVFATRKGWTGRTAGVIAQELERLGFEVLVCGGSIPKLLEGAVESCDIVVVGSSIDAGEWRHGPRKFLKKYGSRIRNLSLFITEPGTIYSVEKQGLGHAWAVETAVQRFVNPLLTRMNLHPHHVVAFGGEVAWIKHHAAINWVETDVVKWADQIAKDLTPPVTEQTAEHPRNAAAASAGASAKDKRPGDYQTLAATQGWPF